MDNLIYDRTLSDVEIASRYPNSSENLKGAYNYTDLNRVEQWCKYLQNILQQYGFNKELEVKLDWCLTDFPTQKEIDRIRKNIDDIKNFCYALSTKMIEYNNTLNYEQANVLEKILYDIDIYIKDITNIIGLQYNFGLMLIHKEYITMKGE